MDNFIAPLNKSENKPFWISCVESRQLVHKWRSEEHAILIGHNTVIKDNPSLTVRHINGNNPLRIILDDKKTFELFQKGETVVSFNMNLPGCKNTLRI